MLKVENISKSYDKIRVLNNISFEVKKGEKVSIFGKSGIGKTTLLKCICGLEKVDSGKIILNNVNIEDMNPKEVHQKIGMVFQDYNLFEHLTVIENLTIGLIKVKKISSEEANKQALKMLKKFDLKNKEECYPEELSGGQKQRVAILRTLLMKPEIILLDEPTSALDKKLSNEICEMINKISKLGTSLIIVSHEEKLVNKISDKIIRIQRGKMIIQNNMK